MIQACQCTIAIDDIEEDEVDSLKLLFSNQRKSGGGSYNTEKTVYDKIQKCLTICYDDPKTATNVLNFRVVKLNNKTYKAKKTEMKKNNDNNNCKSLEEYQIVINNVLKNDIETVELIFEDSKTSGGGPIKEKKYDEKTKQLVIQFVDHIHVEKTIEFGTVIFKGKEYKAQRNKKNLLGSLKRLDSVEAQNSKETILDNTKLKLKLFSSDFKKNPEEASIKSYVEYLLNHHDFDLFPLNIIGLDDGLTNEGVLLFLIVSNKELYFDKIEENLKKKPTLYERQILIERIKKTSTIVVEHPEKHADDVQIHFTNDLQRTGFGTIKTFKNIKKYSFIEFENRDYLEKVFEKSHGEGVKVYPYFGDLQNFMLQLTEENALKICPYCTAYCDQSHNFCMICNYRFKFKIEVTPSQDNIENNTKKDQDCVKGIL